MYAETSEKKSHARIAFALLCGLAVCCSVMYVTADGGDEYMHEVVAGVDVGVSVGSTDVLKAGQIYTETPDGRMRLMDYFNNVEKEISDEVANRKSDIAAVRAQMAKDFAFNQAARNTLKKEMLKNMARNAKIARDHLNHNMRKTQRRFASQAHLANRRFASNQKRHKKTLALMARDKKRAANALTLATSAWQKSTSAWASATNAKIDQLNKHASANTAQIEENAKKARKDLERVTQQWDTSVNTFKSDEKQKNSRLGQQFANQDKAQRAYASNKIKGLMAATAAQFNKVSLTMAKNRHEVDMALRQATMRFEASLNAQKALEDKRYKTTVANIAAARAEAAHKVASATTEFKVGLLQLGSEVKEQVTKVNNDVDRTAGVVRSNAAAQAKVNANVNAEMSRMVKLGNKRYREHLKNDAELENTIAKDNESTNSELKSMALQFNGKLKNIHEQLAADRKHAEDKLKESTAAVFSKLQSNQDAQAAKNTKMAADTLRMRQDQIDAVRDAKKAFQDKILALTGVVRENDKKADKQIEDLTGVVQANAIKSKEGRAQLRALETKNLNELKSSIHAAIKTGEDRAKAVEAKGKKMDKDMQWMVNNKLESEITKLREETNKSVKDLEMQNAEARKLLKEEMTMAINVAADVAKADLNAAMKDAAGKMATFSKKASDSHAAAATDRAALAATIKANAEETATMLKDSVMAAASAITAQQIETAAAIKKTNTQIDAHAQQMKANAKAAREAIAATEKTTLEALAAESKRAADATAAFSAEDKKQQEAAQKFLATQLAAAKKESDEKFGAAFEKLADDRSHADKALAGSFKGLNEALAKQAALSDSRFKNTVKDIDAAKKEANAQVESLRKTMSTEILATTSVVRQVEGRLNDNLAKVTAEVNAAKQMQDGVNLKVKDEMARIKELANTRFAEDARARGALRAIMDENKAAAKAEVEALAAKLTAETDKLEKANAVNKREMAQDLTEATAKFSESLGKQATAQASASANLASATAAATVASAQALSRAQAEFDSKIVQMTNTVVANAAKAKRGIEHLTGVVADTAKANAEDRELIRKQTAAMQADLQAGVSRAISLGEAKAKAVAQRVAEHLKDTKRYLQVELVEQAERAADNVFNILQGKRQKIADNYLSLKAYAVAAADQIEEYRGKGKGLALSSVGDLLASVSTLAAIRAPAAEGLGMGGDTLPAIFSGKSIKVSGAVAAINGLCNEYTEQSKQVRQRWPMGLGKYLLDKLEMSMTDKGVLQVDKVDGKHGNFVYVNGRSVGLSNKLSDFSLLAAKMVTYEAVLSKLTAKMKKPKQPYQKQTISIPPPEWQGN